MADHAPTPGPTDPAPDHTGTPPAGPAPGNSADPSPGPAPGASGAAVTPGGEPIQLGDRPDLEAIERFRAQASQRVREAAEAPGAPAGSAQGAAAGSGGTGGVGGAVGAVGAGGAGVAAEGVASGPFVAGAWPQPVVLAVVVGVVAVLAMVFAGLSAVPGSGFLLTVGRIGATVFDIAVYTSVGVAAMACTAWAGGHSVGKLERAAGVMGVAVAGFFAVSNVPMPWGQLGAVLALAMGAGAYWLALVAFVRRPLAEIHTVALIHVGLAVVIYLGTLMTGVVRTAEDAQRAENAARAPKPPAQAPALPFDLNRP